MSTKINKKEKSIALVSTHSQLRSYIYNYVAIHYSFSLVDF
jgi:hypothetical protein